MGIAVPLLREANEEEQIASAITQQTACNQLDL
jgi:hypothetical protein